MGDDCEKSTTTGQSKYVLRREPVEPILMPKASYSYVSVVALATLVSWRTLNETIVQQLKVQRIGSLRISDRVEALSMEQEYTLPFKARLKHWGCFINTEVSYLNGVEVERGTPGSVRLDVVEFGPDGQINAVYDLKTGSATLTLARIQQIQSILPR
jgi:hypothetical protein